MLRRPGLLCVLTGVAIGGCGDNPTSSESHSLAIVGGDNQSGVVGDTLSAPLTVLLADAKGTVVAGQRIDFSVVEGIATVSPGIAVTDAGGLATAVVTLGATPGNIRIQARAFGTEAAIVFQIFSVVLPPTSIRIVDGDEQTGVVSFPLPDPLVVAVLDERDGRVRGAAVWFEVVSGDAMIIAQSDTTDSQGRAQAQVILGIDPGSIVIRATVSGIEDAVNFGASSTAAPVVYDDESLAAADTVVTSSGLVYIELEAGDGNRPSRGSTVSVHYTGMLEDGSIFDSSYPRGNPIRFVLGRGSVIAGWDEGIALLRRGGKARLVIPPELGYGSAGAGGGVIPPDATLTFDVWLVDYQ